MTTVSPYRASFKGAVCRFQPSAACKVSFSPLDFLSTSHFFNHTSLFLFLTLFPKNHRISCVTCCIDEDRMWAERNRWFTKRVTLPHGSISLKLNELCCMACRWAEHLYLVTGWSRRVQGVQRAMYGEAEAQWVAFKAKDAELSSPVLGSVSEKCKQKPVSNLRAVECCSRVSFF